MGTRVSKISLSVFGVMLVLSALLLSVAGEYWHYYAIMSVFAIIPVFAGPKLYRLLGVIAAVLSVVLIVSDIQAGKHFRTRHPELRR